MSEDHLSTLLDQSEVDAQAILYFKLCFQKGILTFVGVWRQCRVSLLRW